MAELGPEARPLISQECLSPAPQRPSRNTHSSTFRPRESHHASLTTGTRGTWRPGATILTSGTLRMGGTELEVRTESRRAGAREGPRGSGTYRGASLAVWTGAARTSGQTLAGRRQRRVSEGGRRALSSEGRSTALLLAPRSRPHTGRTGSGDPLGRGAETHLGTGQTSLTGATSFTRRAFGASRARRTTFASGTLVGGVTGTIRGLSLGFFATGWPLSAAGWGSRGKVKAKLSAKRVCSHSGSTDDGGGGGGDYMGGG